MPSDKADDIIRSVVKHLSFFVCPVIRYRQSKYRAEYEKTEKYYQHTDIHVFSEYRLLRIKTFTF